MRNTIRYTVAAIVVVHGLIHLAGAVKGFGWADVDQLTEPVSAATGAAWLAVAVAVTAAAVTLALRLRWWWALGAPAALASQAAILTSWTDAKAGTAANVLLLAAAAHGFAAEGPWSLRRRYRSIVTAAPAPIDARPVVTDADLAGFPAPVARYVERCGAVGKPHIAGFRASFEGRIRSGPGAPWMPFTGEQVNRFGITPSRTFLMDATMKGLPADVLHCYADGKATMTVRAASLVPVVKASGPELDKAETVTVFNDVCVLAPAALVDLPVRWTQLDERRVLALVTIGGHTISADLVFDDAGDLVDFVSDDRSQASADGKTFTPTRWSTPVGDYRSVEERRVPTSGEGWWHRRQPEDSFCYLELHFHRIDYVESAAAASPAGTAAPVGTAH